MEKELKNIGFCITASFCTHKAILDVIKNLVDNNLNVIPILSNLSATTDTRFGEAKQFIKQLTEITKNKPLNTIVDVEPTGPKNLIDLLIVAPCTGNTLAKIANGINDTPVTMAVKAHIRNNKPVVIGISTNDALGLNMKNISTLLSAKNFYFVPFGQDNFTDKPKSLVADWSKVLDTIKFAWENEQIQPILV